MIHSVLASYSALRGQSWKGLTQASVVTRVYTGYLTTILRPFFRVPVAPTA